MWVKICANTNAGDALMAAEAGADALGFVFAPSVRQVTAAQVREITAALPASVERVGVFGKASVAEIARTVETARLTAAQLHGGLDLTLADELERLGIAVIHTLPWPAGTGSEEDTGTRVAMALATLPGNARVLIDAQVGKSSGGLGVAFDWNAAARVLRAQPGLRVIVAGGLKPQTVEEAIQTLWPWGVDVASGVEAGPGVKDAKKVKDFIEKARRA